MKLLAITALTLLAAKAHATELAALECDAINGFGTATLVYNAETRSVSSYANGSKKALVLNVKGLVEAAMEAAPMTSTTISLESPTEVVQEKPVQYDIVLNGSTAPGVAAKLTGYLQRGYATSKARYAVATVSCDLLLK